MPRLTRPPSLHQRWRHSLEDHVEALKWSPDGKRLAAAVVSGPIVLFDANNGERLHEFPGHDFGTASLSWRKRGDLLASAGQDGKIRLWDTKTGAEAKVLEGGAMWVERVAWSPRGDRLASAAGKKLRLWSAEGELIQDYPEQPHSIGDIGWTGAPARGSGRELISAGYGGVSFWSGDSPEPIRHFEWKSPYLALALSPDGKSLAAGAQDASVHFWVIKSGDHLAMSGYPLKVRELAWDPGSRYLATGGSADVNVWDCSGKGPAGTTPISLQAHEGPISGLAYQHQGPILASVGIDGLLALWQPGTVTRTLGEMEYDEGLSQVAWTPNDGRLAVGSGDGLVAVLSV